MNRLVIRTAVLAAILFPIAGCYTRVDRVPAEASPSAIVVSPAQPAIMSPGGVVVKPY